MINTRDRRDDDMVMIDNESHLMDESKALLEAGAIDEDQVFSLSEVSEGDELWLPEHPEE